MNAANQIPNPLNTERVAQVLKVGVPRLLVNDVPIGVDVPIVSGYVFIATYTQKLNGEEHDVFEYIPDICRLGGATKRVGDWIVRGCNGCVYLHADPDGTPCPCNYFDCYTERKDLF